MRVMRQFYEEDKPLSIDEILNLSVVVGNNTD